MTNDNQKTEQDAASADGGAGTPAFDENEMRGLEDIEEKLKQEHEESKKPEMGVSGRSVFEIKRIKEKDKE